MSNLIANIKDDMSVHMIRMRKQAGLTQEQLANDLGISPSTVSRYESKQTDIGIITFARACLACNADPSRYLPSVLVKAFNLKATTKGETKC